MGIDLYIYKLNIYNVGKQKKDNSIGMKSIGIDACP